jgi:hypothetical protein
VRFLHSSSLLRRFDVTSNLDRLELCFTLAFDIEITWRFIGHLPQWRSFFKKQNNNIDLLLALVSTVIQIPPIKHSAVYPWLTISQLARFYRVILFFPRMRPVLVSLSAYVTPELWIYLYAPFQVTSLWEHVGIVEHDNVPSYHEFFGSHHLGAAFPGRLVG